MYIVRPYKNYQTILLTNAEFKKYSRPINIVNSVDSFNRFIIGGLMGISLNLMFFTLANSSKITAAAENLHMYQAFSASVTDFISGAFFVGIILIVINWILKLTVQHRQFDAFSIDMLPLKDDAEKQKFIQDTQNKNQLNKLYDALEKTSFYNHDEPLNDLINEYKFQRPQLIQPHLTENNSNKLLVV